MSGGTRTARGAETVATRHGRRAAKMTLVSVLLCLSVGLAVIAGGCSPSPATDGSTATQEEPVGEATANPAPADGATGETGTPVERHGALHVEGTRIVDEHGDPFLIRGISTHGLAWFPQYVNAGAFATWRDWGANTVRLALYTQENGGYCTVDDAGRTQLMDTLCSGIDAATDEGLYVIVDWHILSDGDPRTDQAQAEAFFSAISQRYAGQDNVIYEICNEPNGGTSWEDIRSYATDIIPLIRANSPDALIVVGTPTWSQDVDQVASDPLDDANVVYTLHFYAATHRENLRQKAQAALDAGTPLLVTEFGACEASGNGGIDTDSSDTWIAFLTERGIGYVCWNLSNKAEASALLASTSTATAGWTSADLSAEGLWYRDVLQGGTDAGGSGAGDDAGGTQTPSGRADGGASGSAVGASGDARDAEVDGTGPLEATCRRTNSWQSDGRTFTQYTLTVDNRSDRDVVGWSAQVVFDREVQMQDGWCATFAVDGRALTVTPADYLRTIAAGASDQSIGFIVSADGPATVTAVSTS